MRGFQVFISLFLLISVARMDCAAAVSIDELSKILPVLRARGYSRFGDAMAATSHLIIDFLSTKNLTLLAPTDSSLIALELTLPPDSFLSLLRFHAIPHRLLISDLCLLPSSSLLPTLLPNRSVVISIHRAEVFTVAVNDVLLETPGIYYSADVAVHGLAGVLTFRSNPVSASTEAPEVIYPISSPPNHRSTFLPPAVPSVDPSFEQSPTLATESDSISDMPHSSQINQALHGHLPPRPAILPPETSGAVPRRISPIIRRRPGIPPITTTAPLKVNGHGRQETSVADEENGHLQQVIPPLRGQEEAWPSDGDRSPEENDHHRTMVERYVADQYNIQINSLCADDCFHY